MSGRFGESRTTLGDEPALLIGTCIIGCPRERCCLPEPVFYLLLPMLLSGDMLMIISTSLDLLASIAFLMNSAFSGVKKGSRGVTRSGLMPLLTVVPPPSNVTSFL